MSFSHFQPLFDEKGKLLSIQISPELWKLVESKVNNTFDQALEVLSGKPKEDVLPPEPIKDFELLRQHWDFPYPLTNEVNCEQCGANTPDWLLDDPRKFWLKAANLGGQVSYQCLHCKARVTKKHFKKHLTVECKPYINK